MGQAKPMGQGDQGAFLSDQALDQIFRDARTHSVWKPGEVTDVLLQAVYDLAKFGPTSANCSPARFVFVKSPAAKEKLRPCLDPGNVDKTMSAPVTVIIAQDLEFYELLPKLFPHTDARSWFTGKPDYIRDTAFRNATLQGAYLMIAARALGLDCGPMSGFNPEAVNKAFFGGKENVKVNFLCNIGHGEPSKLYPRSPRLSFDEACEIL